MTQRSQAETFILLLAEGAFWVVLSVVLWPVTVAYIGFRIVKWGAARVVRWARDADSST